MKVVYILAGVCIVNVVADIIAIKKTKNTEKRLNDKINDLAGVVKTMQKERIDDWFESASDILTSHQESIDRLEGRFMVLDDEIVTLNLHANGSYYGVEKLTGEVNEIKEILEKTAGVKFTSGPADEIEV